MFSLSPGSAHEAVREALRRGPVRRAVEAAGMQPEGPRSRFTVGLDLGQAADYSALCVVERTDKPDPDREGKSIRHHAVRHLQRWHLGTPYPTIVNDVRDLVGRAPLPGSPLCIDTTGVGAAVVQMFQAA